MTSGFVLFCGQIAPVLSIIVFMSPIPTIRKIRMDGTVGTLPLVPYSSMVASAYLWVVYGFVKRESSIVIANFPGVVLGLYYFRTFALHSPKSSPTLPGSIALHIAVVIVIALMATLIPVIVPLLTKSIDPASPVGIAGVILCVALFASPLAALKTVLAQRSARSIPLPFTVTTVLNCLSWTIYGRFGMNDPNIYVPNVLGLSFGLIQVALKLVFYSNDVKYDRLSPSDHLVDQSGATENPDVL